MVRQLTRRTTLAVLTTAALVGLVAPNASAAGAEAFGRKWRAVVKGQLVHIRPNDIADYLDGTGTGTGTTKDSAVANAEKHANTKVPQGHYKRHRKPVRLERVEVSNTARPDAADG
ncbi:hypothetical protein ACFV7Q_38860 [Streptomyces sp. NPDC059851]|uniref:hypothetical protein n=1 Tax=Streptomyces sp. NPDC059851 TaxID=3346971 RepID=UPI00366094F6